MTNQLRDSGEPYTLRDLFVFLETNGLVLLTCAVLGAFAGLGIARLTNTVEAVAYLSNLQIAASRGGLEEAPKAAIPLASWTRLRPALESMARQINERSNAAGQGPRLPESLTSPEGWARSVVAVHALESDENDAQGNAPEDLKAEFWRIVSFRISHRALTPREATREVDAAATFIKSAALYIEATSWLATQRGESAFSEERTLAELLRLDTQINYATQRQARLEELRSSAVTAPSGQAQFIFDASGERSEQLRSELLNYLSLGAHLDATRLKLYDLNHEKRLALDLAKRREIVHDFVRRADGPVRDVPLGDGAAMVQKLLSVAEEMRPSLEKDGKLIERESIERIRADLADLTLRFTALLPVSARSVREAPDGRLYKGAGIGLLCGLLLAVVQRSVGEEYRRYRRPRNA